VDRKWRTVNILDAGGRESSISKGLLVSCKLCQLLDRKEYCGKYGYRRILDSRMLFLLDERERDWVK